VESALQKEAEFAKFDDQTKKLFIALAYYRWNLEAFSVEEIPEIWETLKEFLYHVKTDAFDDINNIIVAYHQHRLVPYVSDLYDYCFL